MLVAAYFTWAFFDIASLIRFESRVLHAFGVDYHASPYADHSRLRNGAGLVISLTVLLLCLYSEALARRPANDAPSATTADSSAEYHDGDVVDRQLQQTLERADFEIGNRLKLGQP